MEIDKNVVAIRKGKDKGWKQYKKSDSYVEVKENKEVYFLERYETPLEISYQGMSSDDIHYQFNLIIEYERDNEKFIDSLKTDILTKNDLDNYYFLKLVGPLSGYLSKITYDDFSSKKVEDELERKLEHTISRDMKKKGMLTRNDNYTYHFQLLINPNPFGEQLEAYQNQVDEKLQHLDEKLKQSTKQTKEYNQAVSNEFQNLRDVLNSVEEKIDSTFQSLTARIDNSVQVTDQYRRDNDYGTRVLAEKFEVMMGHIQTLTDKLESTQTELATYKDRTTDIADLKAEYKSLAEGLLDAQEQQKEYILDKLSSAVEQIETKVTEVATEVKETKLKDMANSVEELNNSNRALNQELEYLRQTNSTPHSKLAEKRNRINKGFESPVSQEIHDILSGGPCNA